MNLLKLKDIGKITTGKTPSRRIDGAFGKYISFLTPKDFKGQRYSDITERSLSVEGLENVQKQILKHPSVSVTCIGSDMGKTIFNRKDIVTNQQINSISDIDSGINPMFLYYLLYTKREYMHFLGSGQGSTMPILNKNDFANLAFDFPSKKEQDEIVDVINTIDSKIEINKQINDNLLELLDLQYNKLIKSSTLEVHKIQDIGSVTGGGTPSKKVKEYWNGEIPWITPKDLSQTRNIFTSNGSISISNVGFKNSSTKLLPAGSVLYSSRAPIGYISIANNPVTTNQGFKSIIPDKQYPTEFIFELLKNETSKIVNSATGSTFKEVSSAQLKNHEIKIPSLIDCKKYSNSTRAFFNEIRRLECESNLLFRVRSQLLTRYF